MTRSNETIMHDSSSAHAMKYYNRNHHSSHPAYPTIWNFTNGQPLFESLLTKGINETRYNDHDYYYALPMWQSAPLLPYNDFVVPTTQWNKTSSSIPLYNQDSFLLLSQDMIRELIGEKSSSTGKPLFTKIANYDQQDDDDNSATLYSNWIQSFTTNTIDESKYKPFSFIYYPIHIPEGTSTSNGESSSYVATKSMNESMNETFSNIFSSTTMNDTNNILDQSFEASDNMTFNDSNVLKHRMIGILSGAFIWDEHFQGIFRRKENDKMKATNVYEKQNESLHNAGFTTTLSSSLVAEGLIVVIENSCNEILSYRIVSYKSSCTKNKYRIRLICVD